MKKTIKIGFSGAHATGKTTYSFMICADLKKEGYTVGKVQEIARDLPNGFKINEETDTDTQIYLAARQVEEEIKASKMYDIVVMDRTLLDIYIYAIYAYDRGNMNGDHVTVINAMLGQWMRYYDVVFFCNIQKTNFNIDDGFRSTNVDFQTDIDRIFKSVLNKNPGIKKRVVVLDADTFEKNYETIKKIVKEKISDANPT
ncbi:MAG: AAA family ATPase [Promethearchaeota archaeon]|nr:MAG: trifunctional NAD biosynthesis/regulator protein [Helarchaeota virus Nidhogg Meg22_1012]URC17327.1 MAG: P-loop containing nucleotide triphosphate hydrolase [Helarchaeota virus Nidhogg Meg22_1214]